MSQSSCQIGNQGFGPATQSLDAGRGVELRGRLVGEPTNDLQNTVGQQSCPNVEALVGRGEAREQVRFPGIPTQRLKEIEKPLRFVELLLER